MLSNMCHTHCLTSHVIGKVVEYVPYPMFDITCRNVMLGVYCNVLLLNALTMMAAIVKGIVFIFPFKKL